MTNSQREEMLIKILYLLLAIPMFYFFDNDIMIGGFGFQYQYLFGIGILLLSLGVFLVSPRLKKAILSIKYAAVSAAPYLWTLFYSFVAWIIILPEFRVITRGFFYVAYQIIAIAVAAATLYLFGTRGIYMQLFALITADSIYVVRAIVENGIGEFFMQYKDAIISFTQNTGTVMKQFEGLGYSFAIGFFVVYFFVDKENRKRNLPWGIISCAYLFLGLKRTVLIAVCVAIILGCFFQKVALKISKKLFSILALVLIVFAVAYIVACTYGLFDWMERIGIDTMGRAWVFREVRDLYDLGIGYMGKGAGYISGSIATGDLVLNMDGYQFGEIHNDLLRQYIELGFIGFLVWGYLFLKYRIRYFFHEGEEVRDQKHGILTAAIVLTVFVTFMTDNNIYYYYTTMFVSILTMGYYYDEYAEKIKLPGEDWE